MHGILDDWNINKFIKKGSVANKLDNLDEMDKFLETHKLTKLTQDRIKKSEQTYNK